MGFLGLLGGFGFFVAFFELGGICSLGKGAYVCKAPGRGARWNEFGMEC
jgi:hypothetical protein